MPDSKKAKDKAQTEETAQAPAEETPRVVQGEKGAATEAPTSPSPGQATLSKARLAGLRRRLKAKYH